MNLTESGSRALSIGDDLFHLFSLALLLLFIILLSKKGTKNLLNLMERWIKSALCQRVHYLV